MEMTTFYDKSILPQITHQPAENECHGDGVCLKYVSDDIPHYTGIQYYNCKFKCQPKKCHNFIICGEMLPEHLFFNVDNSLLCPLCECNYGKLTNVNEKQECFVCFEESIGVLQQCGHFICATCFVKINEGGLVPKFPESMKQYENEFFDTPCGDLYLRWHTYPEINLYIQKYDKWSKRQSEKHNKLCPFCRGNNLVFKN